MRLGIRGKLFLISLGVILASVIASWAYLSRALERDLSDRIHHGCRQRTQALRGALGCRATHRLGVGPDDSGRCRNRSG